MKEKVVDSNEKLLNISEAAKLLGVSENTLRDWDKEEKFTALRSEGGHRRYSLEQVRKYLEKNDYGSEEMNCFSKNSHIAKAISDWKDSKYLDNITSLESMQLSVLLDNAYFYQKTQQGDNLEQFLWLTQQVFLRLRFRKMISIQPMTTPAGLVFYSKQKNYGQTSIESDAICCSTSKLDNKIFAKGDFEQLKDLYADSIANEIDYDIIKRLPKINADNLMDLAILEKSSLKLNTIYDYVIAPTKTLDSLKAGMDVTDVDLFEIDTILDPDSFLPIACGGRYPVNNLQKPVFCPYILIIICPSLVTGVRSILTRSAWYEGDGMK